MYFSSRDAALTRRAGTVEHTVPWGSSAEEQEQENVQEKRKLQDDEEEEAAEESSLRKSQREAFEKATEGMKEEEITLLT